MIKKIIKWFRRHYYQKEMREYLRRYSRLKTQKPTETDNDILIKWYEGAVYNFNDEKKKNAAKYFHGKFSGLYSFFVSLLMIEGADEHCKTDEEYLTLKTVVLYELLKNNFKLFF